MLTHAGGGAGGAPQIPLWTQGRSLPVRQFYRKVVSR